MNNKKLNDEELKKVSGGVYDGELIGWSYKKSISTSVYLEVRVVSKRSDSNYDCLYSHYTNTACVFNGKPIVLNESQLRNYVTIMPDGSVSS